MGQKHRVHNGPAKKQQSSLDEHADCSREWPTDGPSIPPRKMYRGPPDSSHEAQPPSWSTAEDSRNHFPTSFLAHGEWFYQHDNLTHQQWHKKIYNRPFALVHLGSGNTPNPRGLKYINPWLAVNCRRHGQVSSQILFVFQKYQAIINLEESWQKCEPSVICWMPIHPPHEPASLTGFWVTTDAHLLFLAFVDLSCTIVARLDICIARNQLLLILCLFGSQFSCTLTVTDIPRSLSQVERRACFAEFVNKTYLGQQIQLWSI